MAQKINATEFDTLVLNSEKPVIVDFFATWCGPCQMLAPVIDEISLELGERANIYKVDIDENPELSNSYDITVVPTLLFFNKGECVDKIIGADSKEEILNRLDKLTNTNL